MDQQLSESVRHALKEQPTSDFGAFMINQGEAFIASTRVNDLANGSSEYVYLENTGNVDYDVAVLPRSSGRADIDISFNATENTAGTDLSVNNLKSGSDNTFGGIARRTGTDSDYTHGDTFINDFVPGSGQGANIGGEVIGDISFTIDSGDNKLLELRNESGGQVSRIGMNIVILRIDGEYKTSG